MLIGNDVMCIKHLLIWQMLLFEMTCTALTLTMFLLIVKNNFLSNKELMQWCNGKVPWLKFSMEP